MNPENENETPKEIRDSRTHPPDAESGDAEAAPAKEGPDFRETYERGYGWGV